MKGEGYSTCMNIKYKGYFCSFFPINLKLYDVKLNIIVFSFFVTEKMFSRFSIRFNLHSIYF